MKFDLLVINSFKVPLIPGKVQCFIWKRVI